MADRALKGALTLEEMDAASASSKRMTVQVNDNLNMKLTPTTSIMLRRPVDFAGGRGFAYRRGIGNLMLACMAMIHSYPISTN